MRTLLRKLYERRARSYWAFCQRLGLPGDPDLVRTPSWLRKR